MSLLRAEDICKSYGVQSRRIEVLKNINLEISSGVMTAVVGASGSGKTTLLQLLGTLDVPSSGRLYYQGEMLLEKSASERAAFRNSSLGFIFQFHHLLPDFTALENVMIPGLIAGNSRRLLRKKARKLLAEVELDHRQHHKVGELSGGEQQRAALARALILSPDLLLADEPTGNLDLRSGQQVFQLLQRLCHSKKMAVVMVTHNLELAEAMDRCFVLQEGSLSEKEIKVPSQTIF